MPLIDNSYFVRGILITQIGDVNSATTSVLNDFIATYEPEFLRKALGYSFYKIMTENPTEQRFIDLIEGKEYTLNGVTDKWEGFKNDQKLSPIANYLYVKYWQVNVQATGGLGIQVNNVEHAHTVSPAQKMTQAWSDMLYMLRKMYQFLYANQDLYPEFQIDQSEYFKPMNIYW